METVIANYSIVCSTDCATTYVQSTAFISIGTTKYSIINTVTSNRSSRYGKLPACHSNPDRITGNRTALNINCSVIKNGIIIESGGATCFLHRSISGQGKGCSSIHLNDWIITAGNSSVSVKGEVRSIIHLNDWISGAAAGNL